MKPIDLKTNVETNISGVQVSIYPNNNPTIWELYKLGCNAKTNGHVAIVIGNRNLINLNTYVIRNMTPINQFISIVCIPINASETDTIKTLESIKLKYEEVLNNSDLWYK